MVSDPELDLIEQERERKKQASGEGTITVIEGHPEGTLIEKAEETPVIPEVEGPEDSLIQHDSGFVSRMDIVKQQVLQDASESDQSFVETIKENVKQAAVVHTEVEKEKASLEKQSVQYEQEKLSTKQKRNINVSREDRWANREKRREYHYNGVKPIMEFVGIKTPMNLFLLYFLTLILIWFFLLSKLLRGTIGALIAGAEDANRPKAVKGLLWTLIGAIAVGALLCVVYLFLKWQNLI